MSETNNNDMAVLNRKFAKTCVEKKRRDRINRCLDELKDLMSQSEDKTKYQKMEKAEILEMAVMYMRNLRNSTEMAPESNAQQYALAYKQCMNEFQTFLTMFPGVKDDLKINLMNHMSQRYNEIFSNDNGALNVSENGLKRTKSNARYSPYYQANRQMPLKRSNTEDIHMLEQNMSPSHANYQYNQYGGSCSSLDSCYNAMSAISIPTQSTSPTLSDPHNESSRSNQAFSSSTNSSPNMSACSSPISTNHKLDADINFSNFDLYQSYNMKVWRPW